MTVRMPTAAPSSSGASGYPAQLNDDRPLTVNSVTVNEASPYATFTVTGAAAFGDGTGADSITDLTTLSVSGNAALNLAAITTSGTQTYSGDVSLAKAVSLTT